MWKRVWDSVLGKKAVIAKALRQEHLKEFTKTTEVSVPLERGQMMGDEVKEMVG